MWNTNTYWTFSNALDEKTCNKIIDIGNNAEWGCGEVETNSKFEEPSVLFISTLSPVIIFPLTPVKEKRFLVVFTSEGTRVPLSECSIEVRLNSINPPLPK